MLGILPWVIILALEFGLWFDSMNRKPEFPVKPWR
jgi:hypothetical protein